MEDTEPTYLEAYPRLNLFHGGLSRWNDGGVPLPIVMYSVAGRTYAGCVLVQSRTASHLLINYDFPSLSYCQAEGDANLRLIERPNGVDKGRQYLECEGCGKTFISLVFNGVWACAKCLGLRYRSQCVGSAVRNAEELEQLEKRLGRHRPKHMQQVRYQRELERAAMLRRQIGTYWPTASDAYASVVHAKWRTIAEVMESPHSRFEIVGGKIVPVSTLWEEPQPSPKKPGGMSADAFR